MLIVLFGPVIGQVVATFGVIVGVARIALLAGSAAGNAALDIYSIVDDKETIPLAVFDLVLEPLRSKSAEDVRKLHAKPGSRVDKIDDTW